MTKAVAVLQPYLIDPEADWAQLILDAARAARIAVQAEALQAGRSPREYACTLLLVALAEQGGAAMQIGDGLIAYRDAEAWGHVFWPQKGEYANTTRFLVEDDAEEHFQVTDLKEPFQEIAVMTDGLETLALHFATQTVHEPFLDAVMGPLRKAAAAGEAMPVSRALEAFLQSDRVASRTDDDLTIVLAVRGAA